MSGPLKLVPWLLVLVGLGVPLALGGGAGWPYVVAWLVVAGILWVLRPLAGARHWVRVQSAFACVVLLVWPGWIIGGLYLLPAALVWLALELLNSHGVVVTE